jgi:hypothetical protein
MGQVKFINHLYFPGSEEMNRRAKLQEEINSQRATIFNEARKTSFPKFYFCLYFKKYYALRIKEIKLFKEPSSHLFNQ